MNMKHHPITVNNVCERDLVAFTLWYQNDRAQGASVHNVKDCFTEWRTLSFADKQYWFVKAANLLIELREIAV